jgi:hypothetical protein
MSETPEASTAGPVIRTPGQRAFVALGSIGLVGFCVWWCSFFRFESMIGDDLVLLDYFQQKGSILQLSVLSTIVDKYRPVYFVLQHLVIRLFGGHYPLYFWLNVVIHAALTLAVFGIALHVTRGGRWVSLAVALLFASARFAFYQLTQVVGLTESLALGLLLALVWCAVRFRDSDDVRWLWATLGTSVLLVFTHERFIVLSAFTALLPFTSTGLSRERKIRWAAAAFAPVVLALLVKRLAFHSPFLLGTGGQVLKPTPRGVLGFIASGCLTLLGVNLGPSHLSIVEFSWLPRPHKVLGIAFGLLLLGGLAAWLRAASSKSRRAVLAWVLLAGPLILAASITFRQEHRWLYAPFAITLLFWAFAVGQLRPRWVGPVLAGLLVVAGLGNDFYYRAHSGELFFTSSQTTGDSFYRGALLRYGWKGREFFIEPFGASHWILAPNFFRQFLGDEAPPVQTIDPDVARRWTLQDLEGKKIFRRTGGWAMVEVTSLYRARAALRDSTVVANLVDQLPEARMIGRQPERTTPSGSTIGAVTVDGEPAILAFPETEVTFDRPATEKNQSLVVLVGFYPMTRNWGVSDGARVSIAVGPAGAPPQQRWTAELEPTEDYRLAIVPLDVCRDVARCSITLRTGNDPGKNGGGDWILWLDPRVVSTPGEGRGVASQITPAP